MKKVFLLIVMFSFFSCKETCNEREIVFKLNKLSNTIYLEEVESMRRFFKNKSLEQPKMYSGFYQDMVVIEKTIAEVSNLKSVDDKRRCMQELKKDMNDLFKDKDVKFLHHDANPEDVELFNSMLENDLNRMLYYLYKEAYIYRASEF